MLPIKKHYVALDRVPAASDGERQALTRSSSSCKSPTRVEPCCSACCGASRFKGSLDGMPGNMDRVSKAATDRWYCWHHGSSHCILHGSRPLSRLLASTMGGKVRANCHELPVTSGRWGRVQESSLLKWQAATDGGRQRRRNVVTAAVVPMPQGPQEQVTDAPLYEESLSLLSAPERPLGPPLGRAAASCPGCPLCALSAGRRSMLSTEHLPPGCRDKLQVRLLLLRVQASAFQVWRRLRLPSRCRRAGSRARAAA